VIRLIVLIVFLFLIWVLFASGFERRRKIYVSVASVVLCVAILLIDGYSKRESTALIANTDIKVCDVSAKHTYRSNFDVYICLKNTHQTVTLSRLNMEVIASECVANECQELQRVPRDIPIQLQALSEIEISQNLSFDKVSSTNPNLQWSLKIITTKGVK